MRGGIELNDVGKIIEKHLKEISKLESKNKDFTTGVDSIALHLIKEILEGNSITSTDIEDQIEKILSNNKG